MVNMNNMKSIRLMRILSIAAMLLSFVVTADAQRVSKRFPEITFWDYTFRGKADSVDCIYNKWGELYISGFDTDCKGTFWFAGGNPLRVSCFKGTKLQWRREVSDGLTKLALFRLRGDSLYMVHNMKRELIVMSKDGSGSVRHTKLPVDSIKDGVMHESHFVLKSNELKYKILGDYYDLSFFNYDGTLLWKDTVDYEMMNKQMKPAPDYYDQNTRDEYGTRIAEYINPNVNYKGKFYSTDLYTRGLTFYLNTDMEGKPMIKEYEWGNLFGLTLDDEYWPHPAFNDMTDGIASTDFCDSSIFRGTHLYYIFYLNPHFTVLDFDIEKIFPEYVKCYKYSITYLGDKELPEAVAE